MYSCNVVEYVCTRCIHVTWKNNGYVDNDDLVKLDQWMTSLGSYFRALISMDDSKIWLEFVVYEWTLKPSGTTNIFGKILKANVELQHILAINQAKS